MAGPVDITNRALQAIGTRSTIVSMSEGSNESNNANLCYNATRQELIRAAPWNFASATATLALLKSAPGTAENPTIPLNGTWNAATQPPPGWSYEYAYPADCERARKVVCNTAAAASVSNIPLFPSAATSSVLPFWSTPGVRFQVTTDLDAHNNPFVCILTNVDQAILCYLRDVTVEAVWDSLFTDAMVAALAGKLCLALTGDKALAQLQFKLANDAIMRARANDGNEGITIVDHTPDWIAAHGVWVSSLEAGYSMPYGPLF